MCNLVNSLKYSMKLYFSITLSLIVSFVILQSFVIYRFRTFFKINDTQTSNVNIAIPILLPKKNESESEKLNLKQSILMENNTILSFEFISKNLPFFMNNLSNIEMNEDKSIIRYAINYPEWSINTPRVKGPR